MVASLKRDIISVMDMKDDFEDILASAVKMKKEPKKGSKQGSKQDVLKGKVLGMVFEKPSLRTRISFEVGMTQLAGRRSTSDLTRSA